MSDERNIITIKERKVIGQECWVGKQHVKHGLNDIEFIQDKHISSNRVFRLTHTEIERHEVVWGGGRGKEKTTKGCWCYAVPMSIVMKNEVIIADDMATGLF